MKQGNRSNAQWAVAVAVLVVLISGGVALGSNMGFKFNMPIAGKNGDAPKGESWTSVPFLVPYLDKQCLCEQLGLPAQTQVKHFIGASGAFDPNFACGGINVCGSSEPLISGLSVKLIPPGVAFAPSSAIVVGAHDPAKVIQLACHTAALPQGDNWLSLPYHSTAVNAQDVCDELGGSATVQSVKTFNGDSGAFTGQGVCGSAGAGTLILDKGLALKIVLQDNAPECLGPGFKNWTPNHF